MSREKTFSYYLLTLSLIGMSFALVITARYGPGLSTDGARYLSTAENIINGRGFYDYLGAPLTQFPPIYPLAIAGISLIAKMDVFVVGQFLNILTFGLVIWLAGLFFRKTFSENILFAYFGSTIFATSLSLIRIASNILSDLLFLALTLIFLLAATSFIKKPTTKNILILGLICAIAPLLRFAGLTFIFTSVLLLLLSYRKQVFKGLFSAGVFGVLTGLPVMLWVIFHNYLRTGILFGVRMPPSIPGNLDTTLEKALHWLIPYSVTAIIPEWAIIAMILIILLTGNPLSAWKRWGNQLTSPQFLPNLIFLFFYLCVLIFNVSYSEVRWPFMDRIHIIILPSFLAFGFLTGKELMPIYFRRIPPTMLTILTILIFVLWLGYPLNNIQKYLRSAYYNGETSEYNLYNTRSQNESGLKEFVASLALTPTDKVYSNYEPIAWFYSRQTILKLPQGTAGSINPDPEQVLQNYPDWPGIDGKGYVLWMKELGFKPYVLSPEQLASKADFQLIFSSKAGDIYILTPK